MSLPEALRPLVVDLDGTLIHTDLLHESASAFLIGGPLRGFQLLGWLLRGKAVLKGRLAQVVEVDVAALPYNQDLLAWLRGEKAQGRAIILATASHRLLAEAVARHLSLFDHVVATEGAVNLRAEAKRDALVRLYGEKGFDYVGDAGCDASVWRSAGAAHVVSSSTRRPASLRDHPNVGRTIPGGSPSPWLALLAAMRPHQWLKNLLVFVPLLAAHAWSSADSIAQAVIAFVAFGLAASSVYLLNDLTDVEADRHHQRKRHRPFASGALPLVYGWMAWPALLAMAMALSFAALPPAFAVTLLVYALASTLYSLWFKQVPMLDVVTLAGLYTLRIVAGAAAVDVPLSFWLLSFSMFLFLSLAFIKRYSELKAASDADRPLRGRGYDARDLNMVASAGAASGQVAVLVLALYVQDPHTAALYSEPRFIWLACPLLLYWVSRAWMFAHRGQMNQDPILFALQDRVSWLVGLLLAAVFVLARVAG